MRCFICFSSESKLQMFKGDIDNDIIKKVTFVLPDLLIPEAKNPIFICITCLEQVTYFYIIKNESLQNCSHLKHFNAMLKGTDYFKYNELNIIINSGELSTQREEHLVEIKVEPNLDDLFLSEEIGPTLVIKAEKVDDCNSQQLENDESNLNVLQDNESSNSSNDSSQNDKNVGSYEFVDINQLTEKESKLTSNDNDYKDQPKPQAGNKEKRFKCSDCDKTFARRSNLVTHGRVHSGERPYECPICQQTFKQLSHIYTHNLTHKSEKQHKCNVCHKTFNRKDHLIIHKLSHNKKRMFQCDVCSKAYKQSYNLTIHKRKHTGEKPHPCNICQQKFTSACDLKRHMWHHTGEKPFSCKHCEKSFGRSSDLKRHKRSLHKNEDSN